MLRYSVPPHMFFFLDPSDTVRVPISRASHSRILLSSLLPKLFTKISRRLA